MYFGLFIALFPLFLGYLIKLRTKKWITMINHTLSWIVYFILFIMGAELAQLDHLANNLKNIFFYTSVLFLFTFCVNFMVLFLIDFFLPWRVSKKSEHYESSLKMIFESSRICFVLVGGFICGLFPLFIWQYTGIASKIILILLMALVGIQLRSNNISLKQIALNKIGMATTLILVISTFLGGVIAACVLDIPIRVGLAMSSGFGWYSLSGILMTEAHGPMIGGVTFLNDILRELFAIILIPTLIRRYKLTALGLCGATAMDFTLPMLQKGAGIMIVPAAIVQGFLLTLLMPLFITFFNYY